MFLLYVRYSGRHKFYFHEIHNLEGERDKLFIIMKYGINNNKEMSHLVTERALWPLSVSWIWKTKKDKVRKWQRLERQNEKVTGQILID
jgi:hypothetical protein